MTQNVLDYSLNPSGSELMDTYLAGMAENQLTNHSGVSRPSYAQAGTFWIDTSLTPWVLKQFTGSNDITIGTLNQTSNIFIANRALGDKNGNDIATSYVRNSGTETIGGTKTFTDNIQFASSYSGPEGFIYQQASTGALVAGLYKEDGTWSNNYIQFYQSGSTKIIATTNVLLHGTTPATTSVNPTAGTATNSSQIATAGWVNTVGNNVMHLTGNESVGGIKTVTDHWNFKQEQTISNSNVTKGENPTSAKYTSLTFCDKNGTGFGANQLGNVQHKLDTDGTSVTALTAIKNDASSTSSASLGVAYKDDGTTYGYAPTPPSATDNSTKIATTAWLKNAINTGNLGIPDLSSRVSVTSPYTPTVNGILRVYQSGNAPSAWISTTINDSTLWLARAESKDGNSGAECVWCVVEKDRTYEFGANKGTLTGLFIPFK